jgi:integrase
MRVAITDTAINKAKRDAAADGGRRELSDAAMTGLRLRITPSGSATWILGCRDAEGAPRRFPLGAWPAVGLREARDAARAEREKIRKGADPIKAAQLVRAAGRDAASGIGTLEALLAHYGAVRGEQLRSWADCRRRIASVFAKHMARPIRSLTKADLQAAADMHRSAQAAAGAVRYIRPVLRWADKRGLLDGALASIDPPAKVQRRERVLTESELAAIWRATDAKGIPPTFARLLRLLILTGQRREEVAGMTWAELSADRHTWTIASAMAKNGKANVVPLCEAARALLPAGPGAGLIFPGQRGSPFNGWSKAKADLDRVAGVADWRIHDIRRTVATGLQRLGVRFEVTEAVLNHISGSRGGVAGIYQRHEWTTEKRAALAGWAGEVASIVNGQAPAGNVVTLPGRSAA